MSSFRTRPTLIARSGLTLIEIMIALTMTLIVLGAMMTAFQFASQQMQMGRAVMEMANRLRAAEELIRSDFSNLTVDPRPYTESSQPPGYNEIVEGPRWDGIGGVGTDDYLGDLDDVWMGTVRSEKQPFRGRYISPEASDTVGPSGVQQTIQPDFVTNIIESPIAEVIWWTDYADRSIPNNFTVDFVEDSLVLHRRVLLIRPDLNANFNLPAFVQHGAAVSYLATNDISARIVAINDSGTTLYKIVANSLEELAHRQVRFCHHHVLGSAAGAAPAAEVFPHRLHRNSLWLTRSSDYMRGGVIDLIGDGSFSYEPNGNDIILTDVAAFDLKVYSPNSGVNVTAGVTVEPSDVGFVPLSSTGLGGFVDLGHAGGGWFSGEPTPKSQLVYQFMFDYRAPRAAFGPNSVPAIWTGLWDRVYDTWTPFYESDGVDQDFLLGDTNGADQGTNGLNDVVTGGTDAPDDDAERETRPPYPFPVRGIKATIRLVEKTTKQIHQSSVVHSYVPE